MLRRLLSLLVLAGLAIAPAGCRQQSGGPPRVLVIGGEPELRDPALGPLTAPDAVLLQNVAQGLVRFDASGNIDAGLAERWTVSDDGLSYIFRIASTQWTDGRQITAQQVARALKRALGPRSKDSLKDALGAVQDIIAMTDRVIEIQLVAPRPNLLPLLAQPEFAVIRNGYGTGPFSYSRTNGPGGELRLKSEVMAPDEEVARREEVLLAGAPAADAVRAFAAGNADLVLGGTFNELPYARRVKLPRASLRFDPASGLFGLVPVRPGGRLDNPDLRHVLSQAIDRDSLTADLDVPGLAARATLLEPGLDGVPAPVAPAWTATALADRLPALRARVDQILGKADQRLIRVALPDGPGADLLLRRLSRDWGALGFTVERAKSPLAADFALIDEVAPSTSVAWFVRRFRCAAAAVCDADTDKLLDAARTALVPGQRYALLAQAAARIDDRQLFIPIAAPVRWSLVARRILGFAGNRFARHTLTDLEQKVSPGG
jgi:oligopeptide transport system substrate-binding protein